MEWWDVKLVRPAFVICTDIDCVSKNVPTLASCSFDKHLPILIIFGQEHQHTFGNNMHIQLSLYLYFYLLYLLLKAAMEMTRNNVFSWIDCWWQRKEPVV